LIEQYSHLCRGECAACGMIDYRSNLLQGDPGEPFNKLRNQRAILEILEEGRHWHARPAEYPRAADTFWVPFDGGAGRPIDHAENGTTTTPRRLTDDSGRSLCEDELGTRNDA
jgi:hypothetical protein